MSNWRNSHQRENLEFNDSSFNRRLYDFDQNNELLLKVNEMHGMQSEDSNSKENEAVNSPWNHVIMRCDTAEYKNGDYQLSSSLKKIWSDVSDSTSNSPIVSKSDRTTPTEFKNFGETPKFANDVNQCNFGAGIQSNSAYRNGSGRNSTVGLLSNSNYNVHKGRAITSRSGGFMSKSNIQNINTRQVQQRSPTTEQDKFEKYVYQVRLIVEYGFLDPKILNEPLATDTHYLIEMLIHYVMEYGEIKSYADSVGNPSMCNDVLKEYLRKINLIQSEITRCQFQYAQQKRAQQEIVQSFAALEVCKNNNLGQSSSHKLNSSISSGAHSQITGRLESIPSKFSGNVSQAENQSQRQVSQFGQQSYTGTYSGNFAFLPRTKNTEPRSPLSEPPKNRFSRKD